MTSAGSNPVIKEERYTTTVKRLKKQIEVAKTKTMLLFRLLFASISNSANALEASKNETDVTIFIGIQLMLRLLKNVISKIHPRRFSTPIVIMSRIDTITITFRMGDKPDDEQQLVITSFVDLADISGCKLQM